MAIKRNQNPNSNPEKRELLTTKETYQEQDNVEESIRPLSFDE